MQNTYWQRTYHSSQEGRQEQLTGIRVLLWGTLQRRKTDHRDLRSVLWEVERDGDTGQWRLQRAKHSQNSQLRQEPPSFLEMRHPVSRQCGRIVILKCGCISNTMWVSRAFRVSWTHPFLGPFGCFFQDWFCWWEKHKGQDGLHSVCTQCKMETLCLLFKNY